MAAAFLAYVIILGASFWLALVQRNPKWIVEREVTLQLTASILFFLAAVVPIVIAFVALRQDRRIALETIRTARE